MMLLLHNIGMKEVVVLANENNVKHENDHSAGAGTVRY